MTEEAIDISKPLKKKRLIFKIIIRIWGGGTLTTTTCWVKTAHKNYLDSTFSVRDSLSLSSVFCIFCEIDSSSLSLLLNSKICLMLSFSSPPWRPIIVRITFTAKPSLLYYNLKHN